MRHLIKYFCIGIIALGLVTSFTIDHTDQGVDFSNKVYAELEGNPKFQCNGTPGDINCASSCGLASLSDKQRETCRKYRMGQLGETANFLDSLLAVLYLIMWPLLYIAGLAMDNTLVYGEGLGLTGLLYQFWSIMRTIANVCIVFVIVYTIGRSILNPDKMAKDLFKSLAVIMLGGVLINASWFLTGAMVDLSTVATYAVGTIPLNLNSNANDAYCNDKGKLTNITQKEDIKKLGSCRPLLSPNSTMNFSDTFNADKAKHKIYYSYRAKNAQEDYYFLSCPFKNNKIAEDERNTFVDGYIKGVLLLEDGSSQTFNPEKKVADGLAVGKVGREYCVVGSNQLLSLKGMPIDRNSIQYEDAILGGMTSLHDRDGVRIRNLVESQKGMIGVMYSMYGNILGYSNLKTDIQTNDTESQIIQFMVKGFFGFAMIFPLIALCIILVMRVAFLWVVIGFAPIFVIVRVLQAAGIKTLDPLIEPFKEKFGFNTVIGLLFQPVLIVFVISMGTMFLDSLMMTMTVDEGFGEALQCNQQEGGKQCCKIVDFVDICFEDFNAQAGTDQFFNYFTYAILNVIGVMLLWFMVFAIFKSNKITQAVGDTIENAGKSYLGGMKILPGFGGSMVGIDGMKDSLGKTREKITKPSEDETGNTIVQPGIDKRIDIVTGKTSNARDQISASVNEIKDLNTGNRDSVKNYTNKITAKFKDIKREVRQASVDDLVRTSDTNTANILKKYNESTVSGLFSNPQYIADVNQKSEDMSGFYNIGNDKAEMFEVNKQIFNNQLAAKVEKKSSIIRKISKEDGVNGKYEVVGLDNNKVIYNYSKVMDGKNIKSISFEPNNDIKPIPQRSEYKWSEVKDLSGKLVYDELERFINGTSGGSGEEEWKINNIVSGKEGDNATIKQVNPPATPTVNNDAI